MTDDRARAARWRAICWLLGGLLLLAAIGLPGGWYDSIPRRVELPAPPISGVTLLRVSLLLEATVLWGIALAGWRFRRLAPSERLAAGPTSRDEGSVWGPLLGVTLLALGLRVLGIGSDLWLDEITPVLDYREVPVSQVIGSYLSSNNHLLYTLLMKLSVASLGEKEWTIRLFAVVFGTATVPVIYWIGRLLGLSRTASLSAALLLAVSYHHIFFSQNARGYSGYLLFSLISSGLFVRGLQEDRPVIWIGYAAAMLLDLGLHLNSGFVLVSHALVGVMAAFAVGRSGAPRARLLRRVVVVIGLTSLLGFQLYATALPVIYVFITHAYVGPASGYAPFSAEFFAEVVRGTSAGFAIGASLAAVPLLLIASVGTLSLLRANWPLSLALGLPLLLTVAYLLGQGLTFTPRFFLLALPLAILAAVRGIFSICELLVRGSSRLRPRLASRLATAIVGVLTIVSLASLPGYYSVPKQPYRASIRYLQSLRSPGDPAIVIDIAEKGYRFYAPRTGLNDELFYVRSLEALDSALAFRTGRQSFLVTTFHRALRLRYPDLFDRIRADWQPARVFPATVGDGAITIWESR